MADISLKLILINLVQSYLLGQFLDFVLSTVYFYDLQFFRKRECEVRNCVLNEVLQFFKLVQKNNSTETENNLISEAEEFIWCAVWYHYDQACHVFVPVILGMSIVV